uniref:peptidyl-tRNA hydrolase n=1 Tax=Entomoneis paludosa TaxID=265537 RepID=A0A7S2YD90_9STRA|mmetsp:Transcript_27951/g.58529  ORF Transcript_27951/g.58529 Transcript_27951/m.58529 type:complete len:186 (+) Transcript_27951:91-648(+)
MFQWSDPATCFTAGAIIPTIAYLVMSRRNKALEDVEEEEDDDDDDEEDEDLQGLQEPSADASKWGMFNSPYKMVLCVNTSLSMGKGKIAAQCCHAAVGCYKRANKTIPNAVKAWECTGCAKIAVKCPSEEEMDLICAKAMSKGIPVYLVEDAGRTQIAAGSRTVLGLGPAPVSVFEGVSDHLKLM